MAFDRILPPDDRPIPARRHARLSAIARGIIAGAGDGTGLPSPDTFLLAVIEVGRLEASILPGLDRVSAIGSVCDAIRDVVARSAPMPPAWRRAAWRRVLRALRGAGPADPALLLVSVIELGELSPALAAIAARARIVDHLLAEQIEGPLDQGGPGPAAADPARPPVGRVLDPGSEAPVIGRTRLLARVRRGFAAGRDLLLQGRPGVGKGVLARAAAAASGRLAVCVAHVDLLTETGEPRTALIEALCAWLSDRDGGLVVLDVLPGVVLPVSPAVPVLLAAHDGGTPALFPARRLSCVAVDEPTAEQAFGALLAWAATPGHPALEPDVAAAAIDLAQTFLDGPLALPGAAVRLVQGATGAGATRVGIRELEAAVQKARPELPAALVSSELRARIGALPDRLGARIIGQRDAIDAVCRTVRRRALGLSDPRRPAGIHLFVGPTGVGKTELVLVFADEVLGSDVPVLRYDMGEYQERHEVAKFIGAPPGYIGHDAGGKLVNDLEKHPVAVVLLDEIEKAHPAVHDLLLGAMDAGVVTDGRGRTVSLRQVHLFMTSNLGAREAAGIRAGIGFGATERFTEDPEAARVAVREAAVAKHFSPEFRNRLDGVVQFHVLSRDELGAVLDLHVARYAERLRDTYRVGLELDPALRDAIVDAAVASGFGGREVKRRFEAAVGDRVVDAWIAGAYRVGHVYRLARGADGEPVLERTPGRINIEDGRVEPRDPDPVAAVASAGDDGSPARRVVRRHPRVRWTA